MKRFHRHRLPDSPGAWFASGLLALAIVTGLGRAADTAPARLPIAPTPAVAKPAPTWKELAATPLFTVFPRLEIAGQTLRVPDDLPAIARHFQQRPPHDYTARWMQKNVFVERNRVAGKMLLEQGQVQYGSYAAVPFSVAAVRWNENPFSNLNWQWYHHQLMSVHHLLALAPTHPAPALDLAKRIVRSWSEANHAPSFPSALSWDDHATAYRLRTLLCLFERVRAESPPDAAFLGHLLRMIEVHARVLADDRFFRRHTNHGFDQALILFWTARALPELAAAGDWQRLARDRLGDEIAFMFTPEGVHVENSPGYHIWMLTALEEYLALAGPDAPTGLDTLLNDGWEYAAWVLLPNGRVPLVGDTEARDFSSVRSNRASPGAQHFLYAATRGKAGTKPDAADHILPRSGYAIFRDQWHEAARFGETVCLFFKCSFLSNYHRHDDDLSVVLFAFGEDWLIDSGLFGYEEDHPIRRYMRSADAHNTVVVTGVPTIRDVARLPAPGSGIGDHGSAPEKSFVTGRSLMHRGHVVERRVEYLRPYRIVIRDSVTATNPAPATNLSFAVRFHIPPDKQVRADPGGPVVITSTNGHRLLLDAAPRPRRVTLISGAGPDPGQPGSWVSEAITKVQPSHGVRLEFTDTTTSTCTLTLAPRGAGAQNAPAR